MKTNRPLISVIVANYNKDRYIEECLDSILAQTYKKLEIIVYDDASDDDSVEIIKKYEKKYPDLVKGLFGKKNKGVAEARHLAIMNTEGDYLTTLDSDDYYYDTKKLEKEMDVIQYHKKNEGKDILAFSNIVRVNKEKGIVDFVGNPENINEGRIVEDIISRSCMIPRDFVMKKDSYFDVKGFDFSFKTHEDWDLKIRLASINEFYFSGINGTAYRNHSTGLSSIPHYIRTENLWKVFFKNIDLIQVGLKKKITTDFCRFMSKRDRKFKNGFMQTGIRSHGLRILKKKIVLYYYLLINFLIRAKWQIKSLRNKV